MAFTGSFGGDRARSEGAKANRNDRNDRDRQQAQAKAKSTESKSIGPIGSMGTQTAGVGSNGKSATKAERDKTAGEAAKMNAAANKNDRDRKAGVSTPAKLTSIPSVNKTLTTYKQAPLNISSLGGASMYGMNTGTSLAGKIGEFTGITDNPDVNFNKTINTDNVNGVIRNLQEKAKTGTLTTADKKNISDMSGAYNNQAGVGIIGKMVGGLPGMAVSAVGGAIPTKDSYFSGMGTAIAKGELDSSRLVGNEGRTLGNGGFIDKSLSAVLGGLSSFLPGAGMLTGAVSGGLTTPASGTGQLINDLNVSVGNKVPGTSKSRGEGNDHNQGSQGSSSTTTTPSVTQPSTAQTQPSTYQPTRWGVTTGSRY